MKKLIFVFFAILCFGLVNGQSNETDSKWSGSNDHSGLMTGSKNALLIIVVDTQHFKLENFDDVEIKTKWIESTSVLKDEKSKQIYGSKNDVVVFHIRKKYKRKVLRELKNIE